MNYLAAVIPLDPRAAARVARRREREQLAALYEGRAEFEHRQSMRDMEHADRRRAEQDEAEARHRAQEHRREERERNENQRRTSTALARHDAALAKMAAARSRTGKRALGVAIVVGLMIWGRGPMLEFARKVGIPL